MLHRPQLGLLSRHYELIKRRVAHVPEDGPLPTGEELRVGNSTIGGGHGLFVYRGFAAHDCLFADAALLSLARGEDLLELFAKYSALPAEDRRMFDALSQRPPDDARDAVLARKLASRQISPERVHDMIRVSRVFLANAFNFATDDEAMGTSYVGDNVVFHRAVFPRVARINHSCAPNAHVHYRRELGAMAVYALRDLSEGEELSIAYFDVTLSRADRQARAADWAFTCACEACEAPMVAREKRETLLDVVRRTVHDNAHLLTTRRQIISSEIVRAQIEATERLVVQLEPWSSLQPQLPELYEQLSMLQILVDDQDAAREAAEDALTWSTRITGADSPPSRRRRTMLAGLRSREV